MAQEYDRRTIEELVDGTIGFPKLKEMLSSFKDPGRFDTYVSILQERVPWDDKILLPYGEHLYVVLKKDGSRVIKCDCGHEFGDYRQNWKLNALVYVRDDEQKMAELYPKLLAPDPQWQVIREYYCPGCGTQLEVEAVTPWYPVIHDYEPDIDAFYEQWLGRPVPKP
ncbi:acetone carboxylase subunit gamma [Thermoflavimicrobium dichotomicum]|uniref:Acetone carboxylase, gamma subunit n=1 Tax=Thermoflavimicrobium dichotomicum TaxID=46223 RepID=A0A1I3KG61_9BACL|nr:acetone carboxylase subunit gamma [Thermoflavimicrobium dichotomicum]SFI71330.1 acetone carboxylase, gamma subunit [Thermoflavimicrobium dichotomicum]